MFKIASFGEVLWDKFPEYKKPGGSPANVAYHLHSFGNDSFLISKVGDDPDGRELLQFLKNKNLPTNFVGVDNTYSTGLVTVSLGYNKEPSYTIHKPSAWDYITFTKQLFKLSKTLDAICFASLSQRNLASLNCLNEILNSVPAECLKVFDLNLRPPFIDRDEILKKISLSDIIKMNKEEYAMVSTWFNNRDAADAILTEDSDKIILLTLGEKGSELYSSHGHYQHKAYPISDDGDFVGVGDAFLASFIHQILKKSDQADILEVSNRYAATVASHKGGMPTIDEDQLELVKG